jgi:hypothetical protein
MLKEREGVSWMTGGLHERVGNKGREHRARKGNEDVVGWEWKRIDLPVLRPARAAFIPAAVIGRKQPICTAGFRTVMKHLMRGAWIARER